MTKNPTDAEAILSALDFDTNWLIEVSNADPLQFIGQEERLYSIMNKIQLVTSRFARIYNDNRTCDPEFDRDIAVMRKHLNHDGAKHVE